MATRGRITTKGFEEYLENIAQAGLNVDQAADEILLAGAGVLEDGMHQRVAKDTHNLDEHIDVVGPQQDGNYHFIEIGVIKADAETARYGNAQEYGTSSMPAQSYIRPTMAEDASKARKAMRERAKGLIPNIE